MFTILRLKFKQIFCIHAWEFKRSIIDTDRRDYIQYCSKCKKNIIIMRSDDPGYIYPII